MSLIIIPNTFSAGAIIVASQHNSNFSTIYTDYNGNIDNTNIATTAAIAYSKMNLTGNIVNADVNASAAIAYSKLSLTGAILNADLAGSIADSKLSQITTASKVSGAALTSLSSIPGGAGVIPAANLPLGTSFVSATNLNSVSTSGNITISSNTHYLVAFYLGDTGSSGLTVTLRFNADTGSNYKTTNASATTGTSITIGNCGVNSDINGYFYISPRQTNTANNMAVVGHQVSNNNASNVLSFGNFGGTYNGGSTISYFSILTAFAASGNVYLYKLAVA